MPHRGFESPLLAFFEAVVAQDAGAATSFFANEDPTLDTPRSGRVTGRTGLRALLADEGAWWHRGVREVDVGASVASERRDALELTVHVAHEGHVVELPLALVADRTRDGGPRETDAAGGRTGRYQAVRLYHSTWPLTGEHAHRPAVVEPEDDAPEAPPVVERYFAALEAGDAATIVELFAPGGYAREPSGSRYRHVGVEGLRRFYEPALADGGILLDHATRTHEADLVAVEFACRGWGDARFAPQAGCAFYQLTPDHERLEAVRVYDDVTPPGEA